MRHNMQSKFLIILVAACSVVVGQQRIAGGWETTINAYPYLASIIRGNQIQCAGTIITSTAILSAAHIFVNENLSYSARVGSSYANRDGVMHELRAIQIHPEFDGFPNFDHNVAVLRTRNSITYSNTVQPAPLAGSSYQLGDHQIVWAAGWGHVGPDDPTAEQLRHVQLWTINREICQARLMNFITPITENMVCSGWLDVDGRSQCTGDDGGPLIHNGVVVGVYSITLSNMCASGQYPNVNMLVSRHIGWIQEQVV